MTESAGIGSAVPPPVVRHPLPGRLAAAFVLRGGVMRVDVDGAETAALALRERQIDEAVRRWANGDMRYPRLALDIGLLPEQARRICNKFAYIVRRDARRAKRDLKP